MTSPPIVPIECTPTILPAGQITASAHVRLVNGNHNTGERLDFCSADGRFSAGLADYEDTVLEIRNWPVDEVMVVLEGRIEIDDGRRERQTFVTGEAFVMPRGFSGQWRTYGRTRKIAITYDAA